MRMVAVVALTLAGCAHGGYDAAANQVCHDRRCYRLGELGPGWRLVYQKEAAVGFYNDAVGGVIEANSTCRQDAEAAPLQTLTRHLLIGYTDRQVESQEKVPLAHREALHTRATAKLDGVPMALELYVLKRNGCIFDLSYVAPPSTAERGRAAFARFVAGFVDERGRTLASWGGGG